jgi:hypothetical protein
MKQTIDGLQFKFYNMLADQIVQTALNYLGKTEKPANSGFTDAEFEKKMKDTGWSKGLSWCAYFTELVWKEVFAFKPEILVLLDQLLSGSATATFKNFDVHPSFETGQIPKPGALAVWRYGNGWKGHIGIVYKIVDDNTFTTIEGNTNDEGAREGYEVARRTRKVKTNFSKTGLNLIGFIYVPETL